MSIKHREATSTSYSARVEKVRGFGIACYMQIRIVAGINMRILRTTSPLVPHRCHADITLFEVLFTQTKTFAPQATERHRPLYSICPSLLPPLLSSRFDSVSVLERCALGVVGTPPMSTRRDAVCLILPWLGLFAFPPLICIMKLLLIVRWGLLKRKITWIYFVTLLIVSP